MAMLLCIGSVHAATNPIDSLKAVASSSSHDTARAQVFIAIGKEFFNTSLDSALHYWQAALALGDSMKSDKDPAVSNAAKRIVMRSSSNTAIVFQYKGIVPRSPCGNTR
ncbi:MAG: hypothetical protein U0176_10990 [Bacteroidia bacterium]